MTCGVERSQFCEQPLIAFQLAARRVSRMLAAMLLRTLACALGALLFAFVRPASAAECLGADQLPAADAPAIPELGEAGPVARASGGRMVAPMMVNGQGPFRFIVDTGANRSAVSSGLAERLALAPVGMGDVHTVSGVMSAPMTQVDTLHYGGLELGTENVPIVEGAMLGGEQGLLGVDGMDGRRLRVDFEHRCIEISPADERMRAGFGWVSVRGELRFGHLVVIPGRIGSQHINILIDTGSDSTLANPAFRDQLRSGVRVSRERTDYTRAYTAGAPIVMDSAVLIPRLSAGGLTVSDVTAYVADFHIFHLWGFDDEPALLIGMDVLSRTRAIAIDYQRATVYFKLQDRVRTGSRLPTRSAPAGMIIQ